jgi:arylsulfatase A-like enzyme
MPVTQRDLPNVLLIMTDQMKATSSTLYWEHGCRTPSLARLARRGITFEHAIAPHPLCVPSRVSLWTSQYSRTTGCCLNQTLMKPGTDHAFAIWKKLGFHLGLIGKNHCFTDPRDLALFDTRCEIGHLGLPEPVATRGMEWFRPVPGIRDAHAARRIRHFEHPKLCWSTTDHPLDDCSTGLIAGQTERFLERHRSEPFCLWVSFPDPHSPYEAPAAYAKLFPPDEVVLPPWDRRLLEKAPPRTRVLFEMLGIGEQDTGLLRRNVAVYYAMVRFLDDAVGRIMDALDRLDLARKTILVFCSDHGDFMGELRMTEKGGALHDSLVRVPLVISAPGRVPQGLRDGSPVNLVDVVPTLLRLQGLSIPSAMQGQALPTATDASPRDAVFSEYGAGGPPFTMEDLGRAPRPWGYRALLQSLRWREAEGRLCMVRTRDWKLVHDAADGRGELYDLRADPWELDNLIDDPARRGIARDLLARLSAWSSKIPEAGGVPLPEARLVDDWPAGWEFP